MLRAALLGGLIGIAASSVSVEGAAAQDAGASAAGRLAAQCVRETRASGQYEVLMTGFIPQVVGKQGATSRGVANVNDCLADKYQVQPGRALAASAPIPAGQSANAAVLDCGEILGRTPGAAAAYSFGASVLGGAIGASIQAGTYQRNLQACLASTGGRGALSLGASLNGGCLTGSLMVRGTRYCNG